jgi:tRNA pseudouridine55 synthase
MDGFLIIDKPKGITSHDVVKLVRKKINEKKVGHAGTLDPLATGLLIIMVGKATKLSNLLMGDNKEYFVELKFFVETEEGDITGKATRFSKEKKFSDEEIKKALSFFNGLEYYQKVPAFSAVKVKGKKLYEYARKGEKVVIPARKVMIIKTSFEFYNEEKKTMGFTVSCSKGTYIRSLVKDIADFLQTVGTVTKLRRTKSGKFSLENSISIEEISKEKIVELN